MKGFRRLSTVAVATTALLAVSVASASAAPPIPGAYQDHDYGGFRNILPPAQGANANAAEVAAFQANGTYPPFTTGRQLDDVQEPDLRHPRAEGLRDPATSTRTRASGSSRHLIVDTYSPRGDVTIERDDYGVPHIYGRQPRRGDVRSGLRRR